MLIVILGIWALFSILVHIPSFPTHRFSLFYNLALMPQWNFFAPNPPKGDFVILYRDKLIDDLLTSWIEIKNKNRNNFICWIWNPNKRFNKAQYDIINELVSVSNQLKVSNLEEQEKKESTIQTVAYLALLKYVINHQINPLALERQFAIVTRKVVGYDLVFTSNFHRI